jgi:hypothetical protein
VRGVLEEKGPRRRGAAPPDVGSLCARFFFLGWMDPDGDGVTGFGVRLDKPKQQQLRIAAVAGRPVPPIRPPRTGKRTATGLLF